MHLENADLSGNRSFNSVRSSACIWAKCKLRFLRTEQSWGEKSSSIFAWVPAASIIEVLWFWERPKDNRRLLKVLMVVFASTFSAEGTAARVPWETAVPPSVVSPGLVEVYTKVTRIISKSQWIAFRTWISFWNYSNCIRLGSFLQCCWSGRTWRLCKCKSCHALLLFDFELIVHGWMLNMFCNFISISIWKETSLPLLSNVSFRNSADIFRIGEKNGEKQLSVRLPSDLRILGPSTQTFWWGLHAFQWVFYTGTAGDRHLGLY